MLSPDVVRYACMVYIHIDIKKELRTSHSELKILGVFGETHNLYCHFHFQYHFLVASSYLVSTDLPFVIRLISPFFDNSKTTYTCIASMYTNRAKCD